MQPCKCPMGERSSNIQLHSKLKGYLEGTLILAMETVSANVCSLMIFNVTWEELLFNFKGLPKMFCGNKACKTCSRQEHPPVSTQTDISGNQSLLRHPPWCLAHWEKLLTPLFLVKLTAPEKGTAHSPTHWLQASVRSHTDPGTEAVGIKPS